MRPAGSGDQGPHADPSEADGAQSQSAAAAPRDRRAAARLHARAPARRPVRGRAGALSPARRARPSSAGAGRAPRWPASTAGPDADPAPPAAAGRRRRSGAPPRAATGRPCHPAASNPAGALVFVRVLRTSGIRWTRACERTLPSPREMSRPGVPEGTPRASTRLRPELEGHLARPRRWMGRGGIPKEGPVRTRLRTHASDCQQSGASFRSVSDPTAMFGTCSAASAAGGPTAARQRNAATRTLWECAPSSTRSRGAAGELPGRRRLRHRSGTRHGAAGGSHPRVAPGVP